MFTLIPKALAHLLKKRDTLNTKHTRHYYYYYIKLGEPGHMKKTSPQRSFKPTLYKWFLMTTLVSSLTLNPRLC
jgi:hypothetical protein